MGITGSVSILKEHVILQIQSSASWNILVRGFHPQEWDRAFFNIGSTTGFSGESGFAKYLKLDFPWVVGACFCLVLCREFNGKVIMLPSVFLSTASHFSQATWPCLPVYKVQLKFPHWLINREIHSPLLFAQELSPLRKQKNRKDLSRVCE